MAGSVDVGRVVDLHQQTVVRAVAVDELQVGGVEIEPVAEVDGDESLQAVQVEQVIVLSMPPSMHTMYFSLRRISS